MLAEAAGRPPLRLELGSAKTSLFRLSIAVTAWIVSLLSIALFQMDLGFGLQIAMEIGMDKFFDLTGVVKRTVLWCLGAYRSTQ
jgi:hypothetical protein